MIKKGKDNKVRIPRPFGTTAMVNEYHKLPLDRKQEMRNTICNFIIHNWFLSNGSLCGVSYNVNDLSRFLTIEPTYIQEWMMNQVMCSGLWKPENSQDMINAIIGQNISWVFEDRMEIQAQVDLLKRSQNGHYSPFISSEVNRALKMKLDTTNSLQSMFRTITNGGGTTNNFFTQLNQQNNPTEHVGVTLQDALSIIQEEQNKIPDKKDTTLKYIEDTYDLDSLPQVCALEQSGVNTDKEGLNLVKGELMQITDNYKGSIKVAETEFQEIQEDIINKISHHESRRQKEIGEDFDDDDPECKIYD